MEKLNFRIPPLIKTALTMLRGAGYEAYPVGGCVRDTLLGKEPHDWDIATSALPHEVKAVFAGFTQIDTGLKHGTVMVVVDGETVEITTFRVEGRYSDGRRPDNVSFTSSITQDLSRRDFTINACAMADEGIIDPFGGREDAGNKLIRCVGDPEKRFTEDALRILRAMRFAAVLNFSVEENTKTAMLRCMELLRNVSQERITVEFCKLLTGMNAKTILKEFQSIVAFIIPEVKNLTAFRQCWQNHQYDVYQHSLEAVEAIEQDLILRVTMFFHDIAKPYCFTPAESPEGHFHGHAELSAQMTDKILKRMKFSTEDSRAITALVKYQDLEIENTTAGMKKVLSLMGEIQAERLLKVKKAEILAQGASLAEDGLKKLNNAQDLMKKLIESDACYSLKALAVNGDDLIKLGIPRGRQIGLLLDKLLEMVIADKAENTREALLEIAKTLR